MSHSASVGRWRKERATAFFVRRGGRLSPLPFVTRVIVMARFEEVTNGIRADSLADLQPAHTRRPPVDSAQHTRASTTSCAMSLNVGYVSITPGAVDARERRASGRVPAEHVFEDLLCGARIGGVTRDVASHMRNAEDATSTAPSRGRRKSWQIDGPRRSCAGSTEPSSL